MEPPLLPFAKRQGENNVYKIIKNETFWNENMNESAKE